MRGKRRGRIGREREADRKGGGCKVISITIDRGGKGACKKTLDERVMKNTSTRKKDTY